MNARATRYTLDEIDRLRVAARALIQERDYPNGGESRMSGQRWPSEVAAEDEVRTYMINGTRPEEVEAEADRRRELRWLQAFGFTNPLGAFALGKIQMRNEARRRVAR